MPRKAKSKTTKKKQPIKPEGDEGNLLTEDEKREKLAVFTKDFDMQFQEKMKKLDAEEEKILSSLDTRFHCQIMLLPECIRKMPLDEFISRGGTVEKVLLSLEPSTTADIKTPATLKMSGKLAQKVSQMNPNIICNVIPEDEEATPCNEKRTVKKTTAKATAGGVRRSTRTRQTKGNQSYMAPPSAQRSSRMTPASRRNMGSMAWPTPVITPKFDPRLPITPGIPRDAKPGEQILSVTGSPVNNPSEIAKRRKVKGRSRVKTLVVDPDIERELENIVIPDKPADIQNMRQSQVFKYLNIFSNIIKNSSDENF